MIYVAAAGFALGIVVSIQIIPSIYILYFLGCVGIIFFLSFLQKRNRKVLAVGLFIIAFSIGGIRTLPFLSPALPLENNVGEEIILEGFISEEVDVRENHQRLVVDVDVTRVLISTDLVSDFSYGQYVRVRGSLRKPEAFLTETGRMFHYDTYLGKDNIQYQISFAEVEVVKEAGLSLRGVLFSVKSFFIHNVNQALTEPQASLANGITVGAKQSLGETLLEAFRITGLIHIVVLSGYNVTIIAEAILRSLGFLPKKTAILIGALSIGFFVLMVGAGATIVRAGIMAVLALIARATGRTYAITRALVVAGVLMIMHNPLILVYDPSFQLSFVATLGLIYVAPHIERIIPFVPKSFGLREIIGATIGTQIAVLPLLLYLTGLLSFAALPVNVLALPIVPLAMFFTFIAGIFGSVPFLGSIVGYPAHILLSYILELVSFVGQMKGAAIVLPPIPLWSIFILYAIGGYLLYRYRNLIVDQQQLPSSLR